MTRRLSLTAAVMSALSLLWAAVAVAAPAARAPEPARPVDMARLYSGRWLEIARLPMRMTDGCPAGATAYTMRSPLKVAVRDTCEVGQPGGREKAIGGTGTILDPGTNAKLRVRYALVVVWEYWILDHDEDYSWFISSDPTFDKLWIYTREVPDAARRAMLVERVRALGYDASRLEFPAQPPLH